MLVKRVFFSTVLYIYKAYLWYAVILLENYFIVMPTLFICSYNAKVINPKFKLPFSYKRFLNRFFCVPTNSLDVVFIDVLSYYLKSTIAEWCWSQKKNGGRWVTRARCYPGTSGPDTRHHSCWPRWVPIPWVGGRGSSEMSEASVIKRWFFIKTAGSWWA